MYRWVCLLHQFVCSLFSGLAVSTSGDILPNLSAGGAAPLHAVRDAYRCGCYLPCACLLNSNKLHQLNTCLQGTHAVFVNRLP
jgi:hypothetical protein